MKQCPTCKTTYTDETLRFCLADGSPLPDNSAEETTVIRQGGADTERTIAMTSAGGQVRVDIPQEQPRSTQPVYQSPAAVPPSGSGGVYKVIVVVLILVIVGLLAAVVGTFIYFKLAGPERGSIDNKVVSTPVPGSTPQSDDKDELRDQIANLARQLDEQKKTGRPVDIPLNLPDQPSTTTTARVNSPGDGFLALRTLPNSETGDRILKIPHGAIITVGSCLEAKRIGKRSGRWCRASYDGYSGWVYDAFLIY